MKKLIPLFLLVAGIALVGCKKSENMEPAPSTSTAPSMASTNATAVTNTPPP